MNVDLTTAEVRENGRFATDLATRLRTTLTMAAIATATCITALGAWSSWHHAQALDSAAQRAWGDLERQRIEWKLGQAVAIAGSASDLLATMRDDAASPLGIAQNLLDNHHVGLEGAALTVVDGRGVTIADSAGTRPDLRENLAVLEMLSTQRVAAEPNRDASGRETGLLIAHPIRSRDHDGIVGGVVLHLPQATVLAGGSLNGGNAALATREQSAGRGPAFPESSMFALHLDGPLDRLGLRLEIAARPVPQAWSPVMVIAVWVITGVLLSLLLIAIARWMSSFILAIRDGESARAGCADGDGIPPQQATILKFQPPARAAIERMTAARL